MYRLVCLDSYIGLAFVYSYIEEINLDTVSKGCVSA